MWRRFKETDVNLDALAFGAHADDVELSCGGTLIKLAALGHRTGVVALTRGEMGTRGTPEIRAREFDRAAEIMGLAAHAMLDIPDARIEASWENKLKVIAVIRAHRPRIVFAPYWVERHPDHEQASRLVRESAYLAGLRKIDTGQEAFRPFRVLYYQSRYEFTPSFVVDISAYHDGKMRAVLAYKSQFYHPPEQGGEGAAPGAGEPETMLSRPEFLDAIETRDRRYGALIGAKYGEPFVVREPLAVDDPAAFFGPGAVGINP
jgi:bacillithiol biosynthesis deacetylase BshB1